MGEGGVMNGIFWFVTVLMAVAALLFVMRPFSATVTRLPRAALAIVILLPALALGLYAYLGRPEATDSPSAEMAQSGPVTTREGSTGTGTKADSVGSLLEGLERRLELEPNDGGGWLLLAKSYQHLDRIEDARVAYAKAVALGKEEPAFAQVLNAEPAAMSAQSANDATTAAITGKVSIDPAIAALFEPTATVFVFAKAVNGSPMPLAVVRKPVSELPFEFVLDDSLAMAAGMTISSAAKVVVTVKISSTGNAMQPDPGFAAISGPVAVANAAYLDLTIVRQD